MKGSFYEFTDEGRRNLMRLLAIELSDEMVKEITEKYTERLLIDRRNGEPFIRFLQKEVLCCYGETFDLYIDPADIEKITYNEEDGSDE